MNLKPNCFEKTKVRWGIFSFFSSTNVETKNVCPIATNVVRIGEAREFESLTHSYLQKLNKEAEWLKLAHNPT